MCSFLADSHHGHNWGFHRGAGEAVCSAAPGDVVDSPGHHDRVPHLSGMLSWCQEEDSSQLCFPWIVHRG